MIEPPPLPTTQANSAEVEINLRIDNDDGLAGTVFTINDVPTYRFEDSRHYSLVLDQGSYLFGYTRGLDTKGSRNNKSMNFGRRGARLARRGNAGIFAIFQVFAT